MKLFLIVCAFLLSACCAVDYEDYELGWNQNDGEVVCICAGRNGYRYRCKSEFCVGEKTSRPGSKPSASDEDDSSNSDYDFEAKPRDKTTTKPQQESEKSQPNVKELFETFRTNNNN
jgi:hypothetical protein